MLNILIKEFSTLTTKELYDLLQLRSEVFVVEQNCIYQDIDGKDKDAIHILGYKNNNLVAYSRVFKPGYYFNEASIGRVVVLKKERLFKYGYKIMEVSIEAIKTYYKTTEIVISAQTYLLNFYGNLGFKSFGEEYLEDGIPHIKMFYNSSQ